MINIVETTSISDLNLGAIKAGRLSGREETELIYQDDEGKTKQIANLYPFPLYKLIDNNNGYIEIPVQRSNGTINTFLEQFGEVVITGNGTFSVPFNKEFVESCKNLLVVRKSGENITSLKFIANALNKFDVIVEGNPSTVTLSWNAKGV